MSFTHMVFDFEGRIGRSAYLLYTILNGRVTTALVVTGLVPMRPGQTPSCPATCSSLRRQSA